MSSTCNAKEAPPRRPNRIPCMIAAGGFGALLLVLSALVFLHLAGAVLVTADPLAPSDAAVILSGGDNTRLDEAVLLYQEEYMNFVIITETQVPHPEFGAEYSNTIRYIAIEKGIPGSAILITPEQVQSTTAEARAVLRLMKQRGLASLIVITDPYHTFRTRLIFRKVFQGEDLQVAVHPVRAHWYRSRDWWLHPEGWRVTPREYLKLFAYLAGLDE